MMAPSRPRPSKLEMLVVVVVREATEWNQFLRVFISESLCEWRLARCIWHPCTVVLVVLRGIAPEPVRKHGCIHTGRSAALQFPVVPLHDGVGLGAVRQSRNDLGPTPGNFRVKLTQELRSTVDSELLGALRGLIHRVPGYISLYANRTEAGNLSAIAVQSW